MMHTCPTCGHKARQPRAVYNVAPVDTTQLTDAELYAHYKATAPGKDLAFLLNRDLSPDVRRQGVALFGYTQPDGSLRGITRKDFYSRYVALQDAWRRDSNAAATAPAELEMAA